MVRMPLLRSPLYVSAVVTALIILISLLPAALLARDSTADDAPILRPQVPGPAVQGLFIGKDGRPAQDMSGVACRPITPAGALECLVVNDEGKAAQQVTIEGGRLTVGTTHLLIGSKPDGVRGREPTVECKKGADEFEEFDGEGVAWGAGDASGEGYFYVVGSHGCSRKKDKYKPSSFLLARISVDGTGKLGQAELSWRVSDALKAAEPVSKSFGGTLEDKGDEGLNIEGLAVRGNRLLVGLRAPSHKHKAYVVSAPIAELFAPGNGRLSTTPEVYALELGKETGIRDMAGLPDGRLLVLSGPTRDQGETPYALAVATLKPLPGESSVTFLGRIEDIRSGAGRAKAEAVTVIGHDATWLRVLVLFDGILNGGPLEYRLLLP